MPRFSCPQCRSRSHTLAPRSEGPPHTSLELAAAGLPGTEEIYTVLRFKCNPRSAEQGSDFHRPFACMKGAQGCGRKHRLGAWQAQPSFIPPGHLLLSLFQPSAGTSAELSLQRAGSPSDPCSPNSYKNADFSWPLQPAHPISPVGPEGLLTRKTGISGLL